MNALLRSNSVRAASGAIILVRTASSLNGFER